MVNDEVLTGLTWADLQDAWMKIASPANQPHIEDFMKALWKQSIFLPEPFNLEQVLAATVLLAGPPCFPHPSGQEGSKA